MAQPSTVTGLIKFAVLGALLSFAGTADAQNELRDTFFKDADEARARAEAANAPLLAPRNWKRGNDEYEDAEEAMQRGRSIESVRSNANDAVEYYNAATEAAERAQTYFSQGLKSRQDAANARAPELSSELWDEAQRTFLRAIQSLERGDMKTSKNNEIKATTLYRDAELDAIKKQYLGETRQLLADAKRARVDRYAPITFNKATQLLSDAERELNENRYDTDLPRSLAMQANYEARHAFYLADIARRVKEKKLTTEQLVLLWEQPMQAIAGVADIVPDMKDGPDELSRALIAYFEDEAHKLQAANQENADNQMRIADMEAELAALDERLGGATAERAALMQRLQAQERVKQQFEQVETMFASHEARVFREGDTIIVRLVGLSFDSGASQITPNNFDLLAKVEKAIDVFPRSELTIEGHTDSHGSDDLNQKLSQERAESVQQYMINAMRIPTYRLIATGYGETRPIASNETESGRARNRRIDIKIKPSTE